MEENREENSRMIWDCGSPLYDSYEIASVGNLIERNMMILPSSRGPSKRFIAVGSNKFISEEDLRVKTIVFQEVGFFSKFFGRKWWKRKTAADEERNGKAKKLRRLLYSFYKGFWPMQTKKLHV